MKTETALAHCTASTKKVNDLLAKQKITLQDIEDFSQMERDYFNATATETLNQLTGQEKDDFLDKIDEILHVDSKNSFWEHNHHLITSTINKLMREYGYMPSKTSIAEQSGLSRQTVTKHLKEYKMQPGYQAEMKQFEYMTSKVLAVVYKSAVTGDLKASKLYLETVGGANKKSSGGMVVNEQNNYIQINNTILSQEILQKLSPEQLNQIELIVTGSVGK